MWLDLYNKKSEFSDRVAVESLATEEREIVLAKLVGPQQSVRRMWAHLVQGRSERKPTTTNLWLVDGEQKLQHDLLADVRKKGPHILALPCNDTAPVPAADLTITMPGGFSAPVAAFYLLYCIHLLTYEKALARGVDPDRPEGLDPWIKLG